MGNSMLRIFFLVPLATISLLLNACGQVDSGKDDNDHISDTAQPMQSNLKNYPDSLIISKNNNEPMLHRVTEPTNYKEAFELDITSDQQALDVEKLKRGIEVFHSDTGVPTLTAYKTLMPSQLRCEYVETKSSYSCKIRLSEKSIPTLLSPFTPSNSPEGGTDWSGCGDNYTIRIIPEVAGIKVDTTVVLENGFITKSICL